MSLSWIGVKTLTFVGHWSFEKTNGIFTKKTKK